MLGGGAVQIHGGAASAAAAGDPQLPVEELEVQRLLQPEQFHHHRGDIVGGNGAKVHLLLAVIRPHQQRSEERRVGKECRSRWSPYH